MKKILIIAVFIIFGGFIFTNINAASSYVPSVSMKISGDWYDSNGTLVYSIHNGYINGAKIIDAYDLVGGNPGGGVIVISEANGPRHIRLSWSKVIPNLYQVFGTPYLKIYDVKTKRLLNTYYYQPGSSD